MIIAMWEIQMVRITSHDLFLLNVYAFDPSVWQTSPTPYTQLSSMGSCYYAMVTIAMVIIGMVTCPG